MNPVKASKLVKSKMLSGCESLELYQLKDRFSTSVRATKEMLSPPEPSAGKIPQQCHLPTQREIGVVTLAHTLARSAGQGRSVVGSWLGVLSINSVIVLVQPFPVLTMKPMGPGAGHSTAIAVAAKATTLNEDRVNLGNIFGYE